MAGKNYSVDQLKALFAAIPPNARNELTAELDEQADRLVAAQASSAARGKTGNLAKSVRKEPGNHPLKRRVVAGGPLTTKEVRKGSGKQYDYALGTELGNEHVGAQPFFFPTYRLLRTSIRAALGRSAVRGVAEIVRLEDKE